MALASTVPSSFICRRESWATLAAVMPVGRRLALVLSTSPPNMGQSCAGKPWAAATTVTLAPSSREIKTLYLIPRVCQQLALVPVTTATLFCRHPPDFNVVALFVVMECFLLNHGQHHAGAPVVATRMSIAIAAATFAYIDKIHD